MMLFLLQAAFLFPVFGALVAYVFVRFRFVIGLTYGFFTIGGMVTVTIAAVSFFAPQTLGRLPLLSAFFFGCIGVGVFLASLYASAYVARYRDTYSLRALAVAYAFFILGMQGVVLAPGVLSFLFAWELMSIAAYFLVIADRTEESFRAGLMYVVMTQLGFAAIATGMLLLAGGMPFVSWTDVALHAQTLSPVVQGVALVLIFMGFGSKAGLVPLHQWLPYAHPQAPSHASALLSGVMLKIALFGFIQTLSLVGAIPLWFALLVIVVGLASGFFGVLHAVVENDMKRLLAWSSIENMGLIFSALGATYALGAIPAFPLTPVLVAGLTLFVLVHTVNHLLFKSSLFMVAGVVASGTHTRDLDLLGGLAKRWPVFAGIALALSLGAAALPPFGTFFGEWAYLESLAVGFAGPVSVAAMAIAMLGSVGLISGLALFAFTKFFSTAFLGRARSEVVAHVKPIPYAMVLAPALGVGALLLVGPAVFPFLSHLSLGANTEFLGTVALLPGVSVNATLSLALVAGLLVLLTLLFRRLVPHPQIRVTGTWDCGAPLTPRMEQTATGFAASIRFFFRPLVLAQKQLLATPVVVTNPWIATRSLVWSTASFWEHWLYRPVVRAIVGVSRSVRHLQGGIVQLYLLLMLTALVVVLLLSL